MQSGGKTLSDYFDQVYFSHLLGMRKPDPNIFSTILALQDWNPEETLFVDDNELNLKGAAGIGIGTFLHKTNESVRFGFAPQLGMSLH
jgi:putative hydrolase of the HAD superfamily